MLHYLGTTAQLLSIVVLVGIISPVVAVIVLVLLTSFIVMTCWIKRHSKGKGIHTRACVHNYYIEIIH